MSSKDDLGTRMKMYESAETSSRFMPKLPIMARLDGRAFHSFCKDLQRPYDERFSALMVAVTEELVRETNAVCGYTQSDEITLAFHANGLNEEVFFAGRKFKMISMLAAMATAHFNKMLPEFVPTHKNKMGLFDCRVWQVPTIEEGTNVFLWRELDATKNSVSMAAQTLFSHKSLQNKNGSEMQDMMHSEFGVNWNNYLSFFKRGTYVQRKTKHFGFDQEDLDKLPEKHHMRLNPDLVISRSVISQLELPPLTKVTNRSDVLFLGADPQTD